MKTNDPDLLEMVTRAEQGETICDTLRVSSDQKKAARQVIALINESRDAVPDFLSEAMIAAIEQAAKITGVRVFKEAPNGIEDFDEQGLTDLFTHANKLSLKPSPRTALARAISEIMNNKLAPAMLVNPVGEFCAHLSDELQDHFPPTVVELGLLINEQDEGVSTELVLARFKEGRDAK